MASPKCSLPSCENEILGTAHVISLSPSESEVLFYRLGIDMKYLCNPHYKDQFNKYISWHNKKVFWSLPPSQEANKNQTGGDKSGNS